MLFIEGELKKRVSVYTRRNRNDPNYYRSYQYFDRIKEIEFKFCQTQGISHSKKTASQRSGIYKVFLYITQCMRSLYFLVVDLIDTPKYIIVIREFVTHKYPLLHKLLLKKLYNKGVTIYWDYDDNILDWKNITKSDFDFFATISSKICVTHQFLADQVPIEQRSKVILLPTTDGDMYKDFNKKLVLSKKKEISKEIRIVWVGTSVNLHYFEGVIEHIDEAARQIKDASGRNTILYIVCNAPLDYSPKYLEIKQIPWERSKAISLMKEAHIGIMPLKDNLVTRGKGGFKLVQYLSIGVPGIASDVGFNSHVIDESCGRLIKENDSCGWEKAIVEISDPNKWAFFSENAYKKWNNYFSYEKNLSVWRGLLNL